MKKRELWNGKEEEVGKATGSIESMREWGQAACGSDEKQRRAFEAIVASFLLTFYDCDGQSGDSGGPKDGSTRSRKKKKGRKRKSKLHSEFWKSRARLLELMKRHRGRRMRHSRWQCR